jgi:hypothetical protein
MTRVAAKPFTAGVPNRKGRWESSRNSIRCLPTTSISAPVLRIGTRILAATAAWISPFTSERRVPVFLIEARPKVTPPSCRRRLDSKQVASNLCSRDRSADPVFDADCIRNDTSSVVHLRSSP